ncbi:M61 family metallopeptidase [Leptolyngbya sp. AN02str]|uniref:M61 family metallopeptidase n=1 Tax=Leptolyngbya sp. AN02str TaxID=3423363 RepID=UPI003D311033
MTKATQQPPELQSQTNVGLHYQVAMSNPESHLFEVTLTISGWRSPQLDLKMPVWTPGSYLVREYARHVQEFAATSQGQPLTWRKLGKNHWQIDAASAEPITVTYRLFANELTVRTNHLDGTHGYFNGAAIFFYIPGQQHLPHRLTVVPPRDSWHVATTLPAVADMPHTFQAADFDTLVDTPVEVGEHARFNFEVEGKPHQFVIWGQGNYDAQQLIKDTQKVIEVESNLFGGLPYDRYLFLLHLSNQGFGGLEHKDSCTLNYSRFAFRASDRYNRFIQLVAHEFFHLWNVKRIRPKALEVFDYDQENYTPSLWFSEGTTSFYDLAIPFRAGLYDASAYLKELSKEITRFMTTPGRTVQPLSESSFDAWIKLYRRDANSDNNQISYYLKGEMVTLLLDLLIRNQHQNQRSMDDVMRRMWQRFGKDEIGFLPEELEEVIEAIAGTDLADFFHRYLHTTQDLPFDEYLAPFGLMLKPDNTANLPPFTGMTVKTENGRDMVKFVHYNSPAQRAGVDAGDELLALNGLRITADQLSDRLKDFQPGDAVHITFFHQDELRTASLTLAAPQPTSYQIAPVANPTAEQKAALNGWLGITHEAIA